MTLLSAERHAEKFITHWESKATQKKYRALWELWRSHLHSKSPARAGVTDAMEFVEMLRRKRSGVNGKLSPSTIHNYMLVLLAFYDRFVDVGVCKQNPFRRIRHEVPAGTPGETKPTEHVPHEAILSMITLASKGHDPRDKRDAALMALLYGAGLRCDEAVSLTMADIQKTQLGRTVVYLRRQKNHKSGQQAIFKSVVEHVERYHRQRQYERARPEEPFLPHYTAARLPKRAISDSKVSRILNKWAHKAKIPGRIHPHALRAMGITRMLEEGVDYRKVQAWSRHSSIMMVEKYDKRRYGADDSAAHDI